MNIFKYIVKLFKSKFSFKSFDYYVAMSKEDFMELMEDEMKEAAECRVSHKVSKILDGFGEIEDPKDYREKLIDAINALSQPERVIYVISDYTMNVSQPDYELFDYFRYDGELAFMLGECFEEVGAIEHKKLFEEFVYKNGIDLNNLTEFETEDETEIKKLKNRCPFSEYKKAASKLKPIESYLCKYVVKNKNYF